MNIYFKNYFRSFSFKKQFWKIFLIDSITIALLFVSWLVFGSLLSNRAYAVSGGRSVEELKALMLAGSLETSELFLSNVKLFLYIFLFGTIIMVLLSLALFSFSRMLIWDRSKITWKNFLGWNGLSIIILILSIVYILAYSLLRILFNVLAAALKENVFFYITSLINYLFILILLIFLFLAFFSFAKEHKVWKSIGNVFEIIKAKWARLWRSFLLIVLTGLIVGTGISYAEKYFFQYPSWVYAVLNVGVLLLFFAWLRLYLVRIVYEPE